MSNVLRSFKRQNTPHHKHRTPAPVPKPAGFLTIGHAFTKDGVRVDVVRPYSWVKAIHRHNEWMKKKNNELLKGVSDEV